MKQLNGESLSEDSKNTVNAFLSSIPISIDDVGKELIKAQNSQEDFQSIALGLMKDLDLMHEPATKGDQESFPEDPAPEDPQDSNEQQLEAEKDIQEQAIESMADGEADEDTEMLEDAQASIDSTSIDEEIDLTRNFNENLDQTSYEEYKIFTSQFDEVINAIRMRPTHKNIMLPGIGVGGYCLTKDPLLASWSKQKMFNSDEPLNMSEKAVTTNDKMPLYTFEFLKKRLQEES